MADDVSGDVAAVGRIAAVPRILEVVCRATGLGFSAVARVTESRWVACAVRDEIAFGLTPGGELDIGTTICDEIRRSGELVVIEDADADGPFHCHPTPRRYGFRSYISVPIRLADGRFFGTLCAIDPKPAPLKAAGTVDMFRLFAELIAHHLDDQERLAAAERALSAERQAARFRDEFLATLAHELRNPLAPLLNGLAVLRMGGLDGERGRTVGMLDRQAGQLARLVDDLLDVSRVSSGKVTLRPERVPLRAVVEAAVEASRPLVEKAGHRLAVRLPPDPVFVDADPARLTQVVTNLLNNAAKYTPPGGAIALSVAREGAEAVVRVADTGVGIPADLLPRVFDVYMQVGASVDRSQGGLGLGLTLVRKLTEMHGGTVSAESPGSGRGSTFTVRLPAAEPAPAPRAAAAAPAAAAARRILVVDDNRDSAESMGDMLRMLGHEVATAHDGLEAVERAAAFRPDVVLMDVGMPRLNGLDATRRIREQPWGKGVAVIALTGWGQEDDREKSRDAGCDGHLVKPVGVEDLRRVLADVVG